MKNILLTLVGTLLFSTCLTAAVQTGNCGVDNSSNLTYSFNDADGTLTISGTGKMSDLRPFKSFKTQIKKVVINEGVETLGGQAFRDCSQLRQVDLPSSLKTISDWTFYMCSSLESIVIPEGVVTLGNNVFQECSQLRQVDLPSSLKTISDYTFYMCSSLESIVIPEGVETLGAGAIGNCSQLKHVVLPSSLKTISNHVFQACSSLESIVIPEGVETLGTSMFLSCSQLTNVDLPNSLKTISDYTFKNCSNLGSIVIPEGVNSIGIEAFIGSGLNTVYIHSKEFPSLGSNCFSSTCPQRTLYAQPELLEQYKNQGFSFIRPLYCEVTVSANDPLFGSVTGSGKYDYEATVTIEAIANEGYEFVQWSDGNEMNKREIVVRGELTLTAEFTKLMNVTVNCDEKKATITGAGKFTAWTTTNVKVEAKEGYRFIKWSDGETANPRTVEVQNEDITLTPMFEWSGNCGDLGNNVTFVLGIDNTLTISGEGKMKTTVEIFQHNAEIKHVVVEEGVTYVGEWSFYQMPELLTVKIANTVETLGRGAFRESPKLTTVELGSGLKVIGGECFYEDGSLVDVYCTAAAPVELKDVNAFNQIGNCTMHLLPTSVDLYKNDPHFTQTNGIVDYVRLEGYYGVWVTTEPSQGTVQGTASYKSGETATIKAVANEGYEFVKWSDGVKENPRQVVVKKDELFKAEFTLKSHTLTTSCEEAQGSVTGAGKYEHRSTATLKATANEGYEFVQWSDGNTDNPRQVVVTKDETYTAEFALKSHTLTTRCDDAQGSVTGAGEYKHGTTATLKATANPDFVFLQWSDGNTDNPRQVTVNKNETFTAIFGNMLTVACEKEQGSVSGAGKYNYGATATIKATANEGYKFVKWSDGNTDNPRQVTVNKNETFTAEFALKVYTLSANCEETQGSVTGAKEYNHGATATIEATANEDYKFVKWSDGVKENPRQVVVTKDTTFTAMFGHMLTAACKKEQGSISGAGLIVHNSVAKIEATAKEGYMFVQWSDGVKDNPRTIIMLRDTTITAEFVIGGNCGDKGNNLTYILGSDSTLTISGTGKMSNSNPFNSYKKQIKKIVINEGVTSIGNIAFDCCFALKEASLPSSLKEIGSRSFGTCSLLKNIVIPEGVEAIGEEAFYQCHSLKSVRLPNMLKTIRFKTFYSCNSLESIVIPEGVESIEVSAFGGCSALKSVSLPSSLRTIENNAFQGCESLESMIIPKGVESIGHSALESCYSLKSVSLPNGLRTIENNAFQGCESLESIAIPEGVEAIGVSAFVYCSKLKEVSLPKNLKTISDYAFNNCHSLKRIIIPKEVNSIGKNIFTFDDNLTDIYCLSSVPATIGANDDFTGKTIHVPAASVDAYKRAEIWETANIVAIKEYNVTIISNKNAWGRVTGTGVYSEFELPITINATAQGGSTFLGWSDGVKENLRSLSLNSDTTITAEFGITGECGDQGNNLTYIFNPDSTLTISGIGKMSDTEPFESFNYQINKVVINEGVNSIGEWAFFNRTTLKSASLPMSLKTISEKAFYYCSSLESIYIPEGVESIGNRAFESCNRLKEVSLPNSLMTISDGTFLNCSSLESIIIPEGVNLIGKGAFSRCGALKSVTLPENLKTISNDAFSSCFSLDSIVIPEGVNYIGEGAFSRCGSLHEIYLYSEQIPSIGINCFKDAPTTLTLYVQPSLVEQYKAHAETKDFNILPLYCEVTASANDALFGSVTGSGRYNYEETATIEAVANLGYKFVKWSDEVTTNPREIKVTGNVTLTAIFEVDKATSVENGKITSANIYVNNGILHIENAAEGYQVFDMSGRIVYDGKSEALTLPNGIYLIRMGKEVSKITL